MAISRPRSDAKALPISAEDLSVHLFRRVSSRDVAEAAQKLYAAVIPKDRRSNEILIQRAYGSALVPMKRQDPDIMAAGLGALFDGVSILADHECSGVEQNEIEDAVANEITATIDPHSPPSKAASLDDFFPPASHLEKKASLSPTIELNFGVIRASEEGDACSSCSHGHLKGEKAIEVGHTFLLGTRYSDALQATFTPSSSETGRQAFQMGCYGLGVTRLLGSIAQRACAAGDGNSLVWPRSIAPYQACIIADLADADANEGIQKAVQALQSQYSVHPLAPTNIALEDIVIDDRPNLTIPRRLKDADLIGFPAVLVFGRSWRQNKTVEVVIRDPAHGKIVETASFA